MSEYAIDVTGMACANCERLVCDAIGAVDGVASVRADAVENVVTVEGDPGTKQAVRRAICDLGYEVAD